MLARRLVKRYRSALEVARPGRRRRPGIDHELVRRVAGWERQEAEDEPGLRERLQHDAAHRAGQGRPGRRLRRPARAQRRQGRPVRQARRRHGRRRADLRAAGRSATSRCAATRPPRARQESIDAFTDDPDVAVAVCSLTGGGCRAQPAGRLRRRARRAELDRRRADAGHRPRPPHRPGQARHRLAHHRRADDRRAHRRAARRARPAWRRGRSTAPTRSSAPRSTCSSRRSSRCSPTRWPTRSSPPSEPRTWRARAAPGPPHSRGSTGSDSSARTPKTHSCTRHSGSPRAARSSASRPRAYSRWASPRLRPRLRSRSRSRCSGRV